PGPPSNVPNGSIGTSLQAPIDPRRTIRRNAAAGPKVTSRYYDLLALDEELLAARAAAAGRDLHQRPRRRAATADVEAGARPEVGEDERRHRGARVRRDAPGLLRA